MNVSIFSLHRRLSSFYLFYFASLGIILPYWGLYLAALGLPASRIGELMAIPLATKILAPNLWGWLADHTGQRMAIVRWSCLATVISFSGIYLVTNSYMGLALVMLLFSIFWNGALPQFEATTLGHLGKQSHRYSSIRAWGSVGFVAASLLAGSVVEQLGVDSVPTLTLILFIGIWLNSLLVPNHAPKPTSKTQSIPFMAVIRQTRVISLFALCFLIQASHGPYYAFFSIYLESLDYQEEIIGGLWSLGVIAEVIVFLLMHRLLPRYGARQLMLFTLMVTSLRWYLIANFADYLPILLLAQLLHAFSFGMYHAVAIDLIHRFFSSSHQGRGQALYSSISFGAGGALGSLVAGYLWEILNPEGIYLLAATVSLLGWLVAWRGLERDS